MIRHVQKLASLVLVCCALAGSGTAWAQSNPAPQPLPFSTDFSTMGTTTELPAGMAAWFNGYESSKSAAEASVPTADALIAYTTAKQSGGTKVYNYGLDGNNRLYVQLSSNTTSGSNQLATAINTIGATGITMSYDVELINNQTRSVGVTLQYRTGETGDWTTIEKTDYTSKNAEEGAVASFATVLPAEAENQEVVQLRWITYENVETDIVGSRDGVAIDNIAIGRTDTGSRPLVASTPALDFGSAALGQPSASQTYTLTADELAGGVALAVDGPFSISKNENGVYAQTLSFTAEELKTAKSVFVKVNTATAGTYTAAITHSSEGIDDVLVALAAEVYNPLVQNFDNCGTSLPGGWTQYSVTGVQVWACTTFGRETNESPRNNAIQINGYSGGAKDNQDWLISPALDLTSFNITALSFWSRTAFGGPGLKLMISRDYDGSSAPATANWTEVDAGFPAVESDVWTQSVVNVPAYKGAAVHVAFMYTSDALTNAAARWTVDDFEVQDVDRLLVASDINFDFGLVEVPNASEPQAFTFKGAGFSEGINVSTDSGFELSKDGTTFSSSVFYTVAEASSDNKVWVRFKPEVAVLRTSGNITFASGADFTAEKGSLTGTSLSKSNTLDIVTWNMEWFGADKDDRGAELGPSDEELQFQNAKKILTALDADIFALEEVSGDEAMARLVSELGNYDFVKSDVYSYSWSPETTLTPQKLYLVYKKDKVKVKSQKVLLQQLYADVRSGATTLENYPTGGSSFWASGRLPFMVELEATMNGVTQVLNVVLLHTRANSGTNKTKYDQRKYDVEVLKDTLDAQYPNVNLVMLGDYNDDVDVSVVNDLPSTFEAFVNDTDYKALTYELSQTGAYSYASGSFKSFLDHIIISRPFADEYIAESIQIEDGLVNSISNYRTTTSDHAPVSARFSFENTPALAFSEAYISKAEDAGTFTVNLTLTKAQEQPQTVIVTVNDDATATAADYRTVPAASNNAFMLTIPAHATTAAFDVVLADDKLVEPTEQVPFHISQVSTGTGIGATRNFTLAIQENDVKGGLAKPKDSALYLYPNPTKGYAYLSLPEEVTALETITLIVTSNQGDKELEATGNLESVQQQLNQRITSLRNGMYIVVVGTADKSYQARLVKN